MHVGKLPLLQFAHGPVGGLLDVRRIGEPRAIDIGEITHDVHHLRMIEAFVLDLLDGVQVRGARSLRTQRNHGHHQQENQQSFLMISHTRLRTFTMTTYWIGMIWPTERQTTGETARPPVAFQRVSRFACLMIACPGKEAGFTAGVSESLPRLGMRIAGFRLPKRCAEPTRYSSSLIFS